jgi:hypothetical protein
MFSSAAIFRPDNPFWLSFATALTLLIKSPPATNFGSAFTRCRQTGIDTLNKLDVGR